ncbi:MAG: hypothetical protein ACTSUD_03070 [Alphaproteobacteria bacterium]
MISSADEKGAGWLAARACALAAMMMMASPAPSLAASAVEIDLGVIDTLPPPKGKSAGVPVELTPPASIRAEIARREAAQRVAAERAGKARAAKERAADKRRQEEIARKSAAERRAGEARQRAEAERREAERRKRAADEKARKAAEARARARNRAGGQPKQLGRSGSGVAVKSANKSERVAPPPALASKPAASNPAPGNPAAGKPAPGKAPPLTATRTQAPGKTRIAFAKGSNQLTAAARQSLTPVIESLSKNAGSRLVIYAYAGGEKARRRSLSRALAVRLHLIKAGIQGTRAEIRALGGNTKEKPVDRVDLVLVGR